MRAAIIGVTGYTGSDLLLLLSQHPEVRDIVPVTSSRVGQPVTAFLPGLDVSIEQKIKTTRGRAVSVEQAAEVDIDVVFAALPHLKSAEVCSPFFEKSVVIDLSADFRIDDPEVFRKAYGVAPPKAGLLDQAAYGLCEWNRRQIREKQIIANPGCYPTATLLPLLPFAKEDLLTGTVIINALSGISGAGKKLKTYLLYSERVENSVAYAPGRQHRHLYEIEYELAKAGYDGDVLFTPHLVPMKRGMAVTTVCELQRNLSAETVSGIFEKFYRDASFVTLAGDRIPETAEVWGTNRCSTGWRLEGQRLMLFSVIDNLMKGASGQAVQNMNIRFGFEETIGLPRHRRL